MYVKFCGDQVDCVYEPLLFREVLLFRHCSLLTLSQKRENYQLLLCNKIGFKYILQPMKCARPKPIT